MSRFLRRPYLVALVLISASVLAFVAYGATFFVYSIGSGAAFPIVADFESGDLREWRQWGSKQLCCRHSLVVVETPVRSGRYAAEFSLRRDDPDVSGSKRAELRLRAAEFGHAYRYAFSVQIPEDWKESDIPVILAQWHGVSDKLLGERNRPPPLYVIVVEDEIQIRLQWNAARVSRSWLYRPTTRTEKTLLWSGPLEKGIWIDWVFQIQWSHLEDGRLETWKGAELIVERSGPNTYNDWLAPYLKIGVYVPGWKKADQPAVVNTRRLFFDAIDVRKRDFRLSSQ